MLGSSIEKGKSKGVEKEPFGSETGGLRCLGVAHYWGRDTFIGDRIYLGASQLFDEPKKDHTI